MSETTVTTPLYTAQALATGEGREGHVASADGTIDTDLAMPKEMRGAGGLPNPEVLFASGFAACFHNALRLVARRAKQSVDGSQVASSVTLGADANGSFHLSVVLEVSVPGVDETALRKLLEVTEQVCPYSNAVRGNVPVEIKIAG